MLENFWGHGSSLNVVRSNLTAPRQGYEQRQREKNLQNHKFPLCSLDSMKERERDKKSKMDFSQYFQYKSET